jgi:predicted transcriptional regulator
VLDYATCDLLREWPLAEATFTFRLDEELKNRFAAAAKSNEQSGDQLLRDFMREYVAREAAGAEYDGWFRGEVEAAIRESMDPEIEQLPHDAVRSNWLSKRSSLNERAEAEGKRT